MTPRLLVLAALLAPAWTQTPPVPDPARWNKIFTDPKSNFNRKPNAFVVETVKPLRPGRALDVGMGQGRNSRWLAQQAGT
jgi:tellurite resistance protein TehB